jgi:hypothetical protein
VRVGLGNGVEVELATRVSVAEGVATVGVAMVGVGEAIGVLDGIRVTVIVG